MDMDRLLKKRWLMVVLSLIIMLGGSNCYAWGVFVKPLMEARGWLQVDVAFVSNVAFAFYCLGTFFGGILRQRVSARKALLLGTVMQVVGLATSALATSPMMMYLTFGVLVGFSIGILYSVALFGVGNWFPDRKAFAMALCLAVWGGGPTFMAPLLNMLIHQFGVIRLFYIEAVFFGILFVMCALLFEYAPEGFNPFPEKVAVDPVDQPNYYLPQAIHTYQFWAHFVAMAIFGSIYMCFGSLMVVYGEEVGFSSWMLATAVSVYAIAQVIGRIEAGFFIDRFGWRKARIVHTSLFIISGIMIVACRSNPMIVYISYFLMGLGYSSCAVENPAFALEMWGPKASASVFGLCLLGWAPANLTIPRFGLELLERTNSYTLLMIYAIIFTFIGGVTMLVCKPLNQEPISNINRTKTTTV